MFILIYSVIIINDMESQATWINWLSVWVVLYCRDLLSHPKMKKDYVHLSSFPRKNRLQQKLWGCTHARARARWRKVFLIPRGGQQTKRWKCAIWGLWWSSQAKLKQLCNLCHAWHCSVHYLFLTRRLFVRTSRYPSKLVNRLHFKVKIPSYSLYSVDKVDVTQEMK